jgi:hypothetical protein
MNFYFLGISRASIYLSAYLSGVLLHVGFNFYFLGEFIASAYLDELLVPGVTVIRHFKESTYVYGIMLHVVLDLYFLGI